METDAHMMSQQYAQVQPTPIQHPPAPQPSTFVDFVYDYWC